MFSRALTRLTEDQGLPALGRALDRDLMLPFLAQAAGFNLDDAKGLTCSAQVMNHKLGRRCTIRYTLAHPPDRGGLMHPVAIFGKLYSSSSRASRTYQRMEALSSEVFDGHGPLCIPAPLMLIPELSLVLQEYVKGADLCHALPAGTADTSLSLAAQWLARLHMAPPLDGLKVKSLQHELGKVDRWCKEIAPYLPTAEHQRLHRAQDILYRFADEMAPYTPVMIHRDFYYAHVLCDGQRVWVLDFDELSIGDPALDAAHFLAYLENLAYRTTGRAHSLAEPAVFFVNSYLERNSIDLPPRLAFYKAYTFLKLAAKEARRKRGKWSHLAQVLTRLACQEVDKSMQKDLSSSDRR